MPNTNNQILKNTNSKLLDMFNASIMFDKKLYSQDIKGSIAHSKMLALQNIITNDDIIILVNRNSNNKCKNKEIIISIFSPNQNNYLC